MPLRLVPPLPAGTPGDPGLTGPGSVTWRVAQRLMLTLEMLLVTTFGDLRQAGEMTRRIASIHRVANGSLPRDVGARSLRWSPAHRALWWLFTHAVRVVMGRLAPGRLRFWTQYHVAVIRCGAAATQNAAPDQAR
jgi:ER-bound oxygenase mpaB/B'/Rubber oxygenase, catalytic domain